MKQVAIIASAFYGNKGASSMLEASLGMLEPSSHHVGLLSMYPEDDRRLAPDPVEVFDARPLRLALSIVPLSLLYRVAPALRSLVARLEPSVPFVAEADLYLDQGGITFSDGREKFLPYNIATLLPALFLNTPVVKCAQAIGPFQSRLNRFIAGLLLPRVHTIVARGDTTYELLYELGLNNVVPGVDLAFSLDTSELTAERMRRKYPVICSDRGEGVVGVCPSQVAAQQFDALHGSDAYVGLLTSVIVDLLNAGKRVVLIPHSFRADPNKTHNNDLPLCLRILANLGPRESLVFIDEELSAAELRVVISMTDMLITSRFHGMISALAAGVPPLVFGWGHKYREVLDSFGLEDAGLDVRQLSDRRLVDEKINDVLESLETRQEAIADALPEIIKVSGTHSEVFEDVMTIAA